SLTSSLLPDQEEVGDRAEIAGSAEGRLLAAKPLIELIHAETRRRGEGVPCCAGARHLGILCIPSAERLRRGHVLSASPRLRVIQCTRTSRRAAPPLCAPCGLCANS